MSSFGRLTDWSFGPSYRSKILAEYTNKVLKVLNWEFNSAKHLDWDHVIRFGTEACSAARDSTRSIFMTPWAAVKHSIKRDRVFFRYLESIKIKLGLAYLRSAELSDSLI
ncbi:hypothetical protein ACU8KH_03704 [Lachancea thermotolerans]